MGEGLGTPGRLLFGRRTYEDFYGFWPHQKDNPFTAGAQRAPQVRRLPHAARTAAVGELDLLPGEAADAVAALKKEGDDDLLVLGSGELVRSLARRDLSTGTPCSIFPIVLGGGQRLFDDGVAARLRLTDSLTGPSGVILATYARN